MQQKPLLIRNVKPIGFGDGGAQGATDILIGADGLIAAAGENPAAPPDAKIIDGGGAFLSPGWIDLHAHVWHGGTDISIRPEQCGLARGVATIIDAGSAGEANFHGLREFIIAPARERILAFLNIGSIGLVAGNRVSELIDIRSIDIDRTLACIEKNRDVIVGIKVRASHVILGSWGITPVKIAKKVAKMAGLPVMAHVGEPPPLLEEVLEVLTPGDVVTHCFHGKAGGSIGDGEDIFAEAERCVAAGIRFDIGHGAASFSFKVAREAIGRGLFPFSISTDAHIRSLDGAVQDLATTMAKLMALGMSLEQIVGAVTRAPAEVIGLRDRQTLAVGGRAEFTLFDIVDSELAVVDSTGHGMTVKQIIEPRFAVIGAEAIAASRHAARKIG